MLLIENNQLLKKKIYFLESTLSRQFPEPQITDRSREDSDMFTDVDATKIVKRRVNGCETDDGDSMSLHDMVHSVSKSKYSNTFVKGSLSREIMISFNTSVVSFL